jgi:hypothetical protein
VLDVRAWSHEAILNRGASVQVSSLWDKVLLSGDGWWAERDLGEWLWVGDYVWQKGDRAGRLALSIAFDDGASRWVIPAGVLELLAVPGLRPEKVVRLYKDLGIASLAELEAAAKDDRIKEAKVLGAALQTKILQNLAIAKSGEGRLHLHRAAALLANAKASLRKARPKLKRVTVAGDFRRGCELVGDLTIVAEAPKVAKRRRRPRPMDCRSAWPTESTSASPFSSPPALPLTLPSSRRWPPRRECDWRRMACTRAAP